MENHRYDGRGRWTLCRTSRRYGRPWCESDLTVCGCTFVYRKSVGHQFNSFQWASFWNVGKKDHHWYWSAWTRQNEAGTGGGNAGLWCGRLYTQSVPYSSDRREDQRAKCGMEEVECLWSWVEGEISVCYSRIQKQTGSSQCLLFHRTDL